MSDEQRRGQERREGEQPESAEAERGRKLSEKVPEPVSGEGGTPLGASDQHSEAPPPHGTERWEPEEGRAPEEPDRPAAE